MALGIALGLIFGVAMDNIGLGLVIGVALGIMFDRNHRRR